MSLSPKANVEVAQTFFDDCQDFLLRYDKTINAFLAVKSRRLKCFNDLRSAYECALKCAVAYHQPPETERIVVIRRIERHGHKIESLENSVALLAGLETYGIKAHGDILKGLPVSLRYTLDGFDFLYAKGNLYYETIGSDDWLDAFRGYVGWVFKALDASLSKHSAVRSAKEIGLEEVLALAGEYNKYHK